MLLCGIFKSEMNQIKVPGTFLVPIETKSLPHPCSVVWQLMHSDFVYIRIRLMFWTSGFKKKVGVASFSNFISISQCMTKITPPTHAAFMLLPMASVGTLLLSWNFLAGLRSTLISVWNFICSSQIMYSCISCISRKLSIISIDNSDNKVRVLIIYSTEKSRAWEQNSAFLGLICDVSPDANTKPESRPVRSLS